MRNMRKYLLLILAMMIVALAVTGVFIIRGKNKIVAGTVTTASPSPEYPKIEKYQVPILMYHYIRIARGEDKLGEKLSVTPTNFEDQIKILKENDYRTMKLADLADPEKKEISRIMAANEKPIVLTFDDGYRDAYTQAFPVLQKYEFIGTFFIVRGFIGRRNYLMKNQIEEMEKAGMEIGSHTLTHPDLTQLSRKAQEKEIFDSKEDTSVFCYPAGRYNKVSLELVKAAGYLAAVTTKYGLARETSDIFELPRIRVENFSGKILIEKLNDESKNSF